MAAVARFGQSDYNASIILASPTCKTKKSGKHAELIGAILDSWRESPHGAPAHGDIWSICTDGDAGRRLAIFQHCMTSTLEPNSDLYRLLGHLPLLNLCCGPTQITHDGDYKHEEKRMASALRSRSGITVNGTQITPKMMVHYLRLLGDIPESRILSFFDGKDPQNVPKANALLTSIYRASQLPNIVAQVAHKPFVLLGEVLGSFVHPYTTLTMSLKEQLTSLAKCAHLLFALYRTDGTRFLTGQLMYDIQASIKNAFFCVAKTQLADLNLPFYLLQTGTDRLESRFGSFRTMCERAASAQHIDQIYAARPQWNRVPYRLSLDGNSGVDHTNPASWRGNVIVGHVDLYSCWIDGQSQAANALNRAGVSFNFDPATLSLESPQIDLMRPTGKYPGIQVDTLEPNPQPALPEDLVDDPRVLDTEITGRSNDSGQSLRLGDDELSIEHLLPASPEESLEHNGNDFHVSELVATLLRINNQVSIAVIRVTNIVARDGRALESIAEKHFCESGITLSGQVLVLEYSSGVWYWTQQYDSIATTGASAHQKRSSGADFSTHFSLPVNPLLVEWRGEQVWAFEDVEMRTLMNELWTKCAGNAPETQIPACVSSASLPYRSPDSQNLLCHSEATELIRSAA
ncbi:hypothetical protein FRC07_010692, partial [Ceratobasidium sp. 392]